MVVVVARMPPPHVVDGFVVGGLRCVAGAAMVVLAIVVVWVVLDVVGLLGLVGVVLGQTGPDILGWGLWPSSLRGPLGGPPHLWESFA